MLGIIGAMDMEIDLLLKRMENAEESRVGYTVFHAGTLSGVPVCLARCGIGKVHAALCAQGMLLRYPVEAMLNIGVAGALREGLAVGDLVIASSCVQHDIDTTPIGDPPGLISGPNIVHVPCDGELVSLLEQAAAQCGFKAVEAAIATGDQFIAGIEKKDALSRDFGAAACDMEGGAIAQCCYEMGVPFAAFRAISDTRGGDGREYAEKAAFACAREQKLLPHFLSLYLNAGKERRHG